MSDIAVRRAVAKCAGWRWIGLERVKSKGVKFQYASTGGTPFFRLRTDKPISWDDVMAACEAAGITHIRLAKRGDKWVAAVKEAALLDDSRPPRDGPDALAYALCDACGVAVEDE